MDLSSKSDAVDPTQPSLKKNRLLRLRHSYRGTRRRSSRVCDHAATFAGIGSAPGALPCPHAQLSNPRARGVARGSALLPWLYLALHARVQGSRMHVVLTTALCVPV